MRHFVFILAIVPALVILGYVLISPAYLGDYLWVIIAFPFSLAIARELRDYTTGRNAESHRQIIQVTLEPVEDDDQAEDDLDDTFDSPVGMWTGSVSIWPGKPEEVLQVMPLQLAISDDGHNASIIPSDVPDTGPRITEAQVLDYEPRTGYLDLNLVIEREGHRQNLESKLTLNHNKLIPDDDTQDVTVELHRAHPTAVIA